MTRRTINLAQFWLTITFFIVPSVAFAAAGYLRFLSGYFTPADVSFYSYLRLTVFVTLFWVLIVERLGLNRIEPLLALQTGVLTAAKATVYCAVSILSVLFFYRGASFARVFIVIGCAFIFLLSVAVIHIFRGMIHMLKKFANGASPVAILGADGFAVRIANHLRTNPLTHCTVACFVTLPEQRPETLDAPVLQWDNLDEVVETYHCKEAILALPPHRFGEAQSIFERVQHLCIPTRMALDLGDGVFVPSRLFDFCGLPLLDVRPYPVETVSYAIGKRIFDVVLCCFLLAILSPLFILIIFMIKLTSRGPAFFAQERVSLNGRRFAMLKFRTMYVHDSRESDTRHTQRGDCRITPIGRILRRTSLDELPQFINVVKGDMSVVGPRPELTYFVQKFRQEIPRYMTRHNIKCGITGWAQINGLRGSDSSIPQRIQYDLYYMRNWSLILDLKIIFFTVFNGLLNRNAY
jgi:exopolysaccharide biosynthesis polyprenyl glycosylphosphotransferase